MFAYIYRTKNLINGREYIGQHHGEFDPGYLGSGQNIRLAINKYGRDNFSVEMISRAETQDELDSLEIESIRLYRSNGRDIYNILPGGKGVKPEIMNRISNALKGRPKSPEHIQKMKDRMNSKESKEFMSKVHKGKKIPDHMREAQSKLMTGRKLSEEHKKKISQSSNPVRTKESNELRSKKLMGRIITPEWAAKISASKKRSRELKLSSEKLTINKTGDK